MTLARTLGGMTVDEMLERMSSLELGMWLALYELEGEEDEFKQNHRALVDSFK